MTVIDGSGLQFVDLPGRQAADPLVEATSESSLRIVEMERTAGRTAHRHPHSEEVVYIDRGHGEVWIEGVRRPVQTGDVVHIPAGAAHATVPAPGESMRLICFFPHPNLAENIENTDIGVS